MIVIGSILLGILVEWACIKTKHPITIVCGTVSAFGFITFGILYATMYGV